MDFYDSAVRMISALAVVLGLMMILMIVIRRVPAARPFMRGLLRADTSAIEVLSTGYLGPRKSISLVAVAGEILIIGTTSTDLIPLGRIQDAERIRTLLSKREIAAKPERTAP